MTRATQKKKVLILDDDPSIVMCIEHLLRRRGYRPLPSTGWAEAMDLIRSEQPDLLLLDLSMPTVEGRAFLEFLRSEGWQEPAIVISGSVCDETRRSLGPLGVSAFIPKPFDLEELGNAIALCLPAQDAPPAPSSCGAPGEAVDERWSVDDVIFMEASLSATLEPAKASRSTRSEAKASRADARVRRRTYLAAGARKRVIRQLTILAASCLAIAALLAVFNLVASNVTLRGITNNVQKSLAESSRDRSERPVIP